MNMGRKSFMFILCCLLIVNLGQGFSWYTTPFPTTDSTSWYTSPYGSCQYSCGNYVGSCSCRSSCSYYGNCCPDYNTYCAATTPSPASCQNNCGNYAGSCSCTSYCSFYNNCCNDYQDYCPTSTPEDTTVYTTPGGSCQYSCGNYVGSCSCRSYCSYYGNCCPDYNTYCSATTPTPDSVYTTPDGSCQYSCGNYVGSCSCRSTCSYYGNCCPDYNTYCAATTPSPEYTTPSGSCQHSCGNYVGSCSCRSTCSYYGNCCPDYNTYCAATTPVEPTPYGSCRYNCGYNLGACSCTSSCRYYGNCCHDYYMYCEITTQSPYTTEMYPECGGNLYNSGSFSSPYYPSYYHDHAYCVWHISAPSKQQVILTIADMQLENCCTCDYIAVYDGPNVGSNFLGKVCYNGTHEEFHSSSRYMTVLFRSDGSIVGRGFRAEFFSSLPSSSGRVDCSSDNMNIVIQKSYLDSIGYSGHDLYLNDQYCRPQISYYQVVFSFALNTCGTRRESQHGRIVYTNAIRAYQSRSGEISRQSHFKLSVRCKMEQDATAQIMYVAREREEGNITGSGRYNVSMRFYTSGNFYYPVYDSPYFVNLNQYLYVQVNLRTADSSLVLFLDTCVASPSPFDFHTRSYDLVRNGCKRDGTYYEYSSGTRDVAQFRFQAFAFLRSHSTVYLQCKVAVCQAYDYHSRCYQGCQMRKSRSLKTSADQETATVTLGPIQLRDPQKTAEEVPDADEGIIQAAV